MNNQMRLLRQQGSADATDSCSSPVFALGPEHDSRAFAGFDDIAAAYQGHAANTKSRSPVAEVEEHIRVLEGGLGTLAFSNAMAIYDALFGCLLKSGDHVIASAVLPAPTAALLRQYCEQFSIAVSFVDAGDPLTVANAYRPETRMLVAETIGSLGADMPALAEIGHFVAGKPLLYVLDNSIPSSLAFQARAVGAHLVVQRFHKAISSGRHIAGACLTDTGLFDASPGYATMISKKWRGQAGGALLAQLRNGRFNKGSCLGAEMAEALLSDMESASLRVERIGATAQTLAERLSDHPFITHVNYPGLPSHPQHDMVAAMLANGGGLLSFNVVEHLSVRIFYDTLRLATRGDQIGDTRTQVIHPASTLFAHLDDHVRQSLNIPDTLIRVSVGLEPAEALVDDFFNALQVAKELDFIKDCHFS